MSILKRHIKKLFSNNKICTWEEKYMEAVRVYHIVITIWIIIWVN